MVCGACAGCCRDRNAGASVLSAHQLLHDSMQFCDQVIAMVKVVSPATGAQLMRPVAGRWRIALPFGARRIEQVNIPGHSLLSTQTLSDGLANSFLRVVELINTGIVQDSGRCLGRDEVIQRKHVDPDHARADVGIWKIAENGSLRRTGAFHAGRSSGRDHSQKSELVFVAVEAILERLQGIGERNDF